MHDVKKMFHPFGMYCWKNYESKRTVSFHTLSIKSDILTTVDCSLLLLELFLVTFQG